MPAHDRHSWAQAKGTGGNVEGYGMWRGRVMAIGHLWDEGHLMESVDAAAREVLDIHAHAMGSHDAKG